MKDGRRLDSVNGFNNMDMMYWEWLCSLFPKYTAPKIDPTLLKCECGYSWHFGKLDYIRMILFNHIIVTCPQCQRKHYYNLSYHIIKEVDKTKAENNELTKCKTKVWENG